MKNISTTVRDRWLYFVTWNWLDEIHVPVLSLSGMLKNLWLHNAREYAVRGLYDFPYIRDSVIHDLTV